MNRLGRKQCSAIVRVRSRMMPTKENNQGSYQDEQCRVCKTGAIETQAHILEECEEMKKLTGSCIRYTDIFIDEDIEKLKTAANQVNRVLEELEKIKQ